MLKARIDQLVNREGSNTRAIVSVTIDDAFAVHEIKVVESKDKGKLFVIMPGGRNDRVNDVFHAITKEARDELTDAVLEAYVKRLLDATLDS